MLLAEVAATWRQVAATGSRTAKVAALAAALARTGPADAAAVSAYLSGRLRQRRTGVGWATLPPDLPPAAAAAILTVSEADGVFAALAAVSGTGAQGRRRRLLAGLFGRATADEQALLLGLLSGELRQGALEALVVDAWARAAGARLADVRRAVMLAGGLEPVAEALAAGGAGGLAAFVLAVGAPLRPMLAQPAVDLADALRRVPPPVAVEYKLDGIRAQVHLDRRGQGGTAAVGVFTRSLDDITGRVPEVVAVARQLPAASAVLDAELLAVGSDGRPRPFQVTAGRTGSRLDVSRSAVEVPLSVFFFDLLHLDGRDLVGLPGGERADRLAALVPAGHRVPRLVTDDATAAGRFLAEALAAGHEGVVVKALDAPYEAGRRGAAWVKVKPRHTLDLVVLAAEWGHGRRRGRLSNLHLGARDPGGGATGFAMLGKTFKGLTDALLAWQTEHLLARADGPIDAPVVRVRPELVVEIAFDGVQASPRYPAGVTLRFARVLRYRPDKSADEADTVDTVRALQAGGAAPPRARSPGPPRPGPAVSGSPS